MNFSLWVGIKRLFGLGGSATDSPVGRQTGTPETYNTGTASMVSEDTALQVSTVWACARLLAEVFASLPVDVYQRNAAGALRADLGNLNYLLQISPNRLQTKVEFFENMQLNLCLHGNAYARLQRNNSGQVVALWPLPAQHVTPVLQPGGDLVYHWFHGNDVTVIADQNVLHVKLFGNGLVGLSPLAYARNTVGLALAGDEYASKYFTHGGRPSGVLYTDQALDAAQRRQARENFAEVVEEKEESNRLLVLPLGFRYQQVQIGPADMQLLESRKHSATELCRYFGNVPAPLVGVMHESTVWGSGIEQMFLAWYRTGLNPYASRWEQAIERKLMTPAQRRQYKIEFDFDHILRGDSKTLAEVLKSLTGGPLMTPNEGRAKLQLPPLADADKLNPAPSVGQKAGEQSQKEGTENENLV